VPSPSVRLPWFNHIDVCFYLRLAELITKLMNAHTNVFADGLKRNKKKTETSLNWKKRKREQIMQNL